MAVVLSWPRHVSHTLKVTSSTRDYKTFSLDYYYNEDTTPYGVNGNGNGLSYLCRNHLEYGQIILDVSEINSSVKYP